MAIETRAEEPDELRKKLVRRISVAVVLIAVLLGGLSFFDTMMAPKAPPPPPPQPSLPEARPQAESVIEAGKPEEQPVKAEPERTEMPLATPPSEPAKSAPGLARSAKSPAPVPPVETVAPVRIAEHTATKTPPKTLPKRTEPNVVESRLQQIKPGETKPVPALAVMRGYVLQMGVFTNTANAEELHAKLEKAGIPSTIEAHVQVGPFKTRQEAIEAQAKLKSLGLGGGLLLPPRK